MKNRNKQLKHSMILIALLFSGLVWGQESKTIIRITECTGIEKLLINNKHSKMEIICWDKNEVKVESIARIVGKTEEDEALVIRAIKDCSPQINGNELSLDLVFWSSWNQNNRKIKMELNNGKDVRLSELKVNHIIYIPKKMSLKIHNSYSEVQLPDIDGDLITKAHSSKIFGGEVSGRCSMDNKYCKIELGNIGAAQMKLYDCTLSFDNCNGDIGFDSKYSEIEGQSAKNTEIKSYDDDFSINKLENIRAEMKYSEMKGDECGNISMDLYDCDLKFSKSNNIEISSKYSSFRFAYCSAVIFESSFDDTFISGESESLNVNDKYSEWNIERLNHSLKAESYSSSFDIDYMPADFSSIEIEAKYGSANIDFPENASYNLIAEMQYGSLDYPEEEFISNHIEKSSSSKKIKTNGKNCGENCPKIIIDTYSMNIRLRHIK